MGLLRSIGAILGGFLAIGVFSFVTNNFPTSLPLTLVLLFLGWACGGYVAAAIAPNSPVKHALVLGGLGAVMGFFTMLFYAVMLGAPLYSVLIAALPLTGAFIGGKIFEMTRTKVLQKNIASDKQESRAEGGGKRVLSKSRKRKK